MFVCLLAMAGWPLLVASAPATDDSKMGEVDPLEIQRRAIDTLNRVVEQVRRTGNSDLGSAALPGIDRDLTSSNDILLRRGPSRELAQGLMKQGSTARLLGDNRRAVVLYGRATQVAQAFGDKAQQADALAWKAQAHLNLRELDAANLAVRTAMALEGSFSDPDVLSRVLGMRSSVLAARGDLDGAAVAADRQVAVAANASDPMSIYFALLERADVQIKRAATCDFKMVFAACLAAADRAQNDLREGREVVKRLKFFGLVRSSGELIESIEMRKWVIAGRQKLFDSTPQFHPTKAEDVLVTSRFTIKGRGGPLAADLEMKARTGNTLEEAFEAMRVANPLAAGQDATMLFIAGSIADGRGDADTALSRYQDAIVALERDRRALGDERARNSYMENRIAPYYEAIRHLLERGRTAEAFELLERSRSRVLADLLYSSPPTLRKDRDRALMSQVVERRARIAKTQDDLLTFPGDDPDTPKRLERLRSDEALLSASMREMATQSPPLADLLDSKPSSLAALQASMRAEGYETLQYLVTDSGLIVWHITAKEVFVRNVFLPRGALMDKVAALSKSLRPEQAFDEKMSNELFLFLVQPVLQRLHTGRVVIVPHEDLAGLPFAALKNPASGAFFGDRQPISYAPSASLLLTLKPSQPLGTARVVAFGNRSTGGAAEELAAIGRAFSTRANINTDNLPGESQVKSGVAGVDVVHLAVHGEFNAAEPMLSHLNLRADAGEDGQLTAAEMFGLPLENARLVVLSACESGRAQVTHANETLGISRALLFAGANALLLSQWKVDSHVTSDWMKAFYEVAQEKTPAEAARIASIRVRESPGRSHPYYWAAFSLLAR